MLRLASVALFLVALATPAAAEDPKFAITVRDHQFVPAELTVPAGVKVELVIKNEQTTPAEFESSSLHREKVIKPGSTVSVFVGPLTPGRYEFLDDFNRATKGVLVAK
jgi:plastocyanin